MLTMLPIISSPVTPNDIRYAFKYARKKRHVREEFCTAFSNFIRSQYVYAANSGISSFYIILEALKRLSTKKEVVLPAYTAGSLVVAVKKAGLVPILCDISKADAGIDVDSLPNAITRNTLAIIGVHAFGMAMKEIENMRRRIPDDVFFIEDCAQSLGTAVGERLTGSYGDVSFFSFNRGKNLPLCGSGCIATNNKKIAAAIEAKIRDLEGTSSPSEVSALFSMLSFSIAVNPFVYGIGFPVIARFKDNAPPKDFEVANMNEFHAALGLELMQRKDELFAKRYQNGTYLLEGLRGANGVILPDIHEDNYTVFNRLPVLFEDLNKITPTEEALRKSGIETSRMYIRPLHHMFDLGYNKEDFPQANYIAERLLTLPVHPAVGRETLSKMIDAIRQI